MSVTDAVSITEHPYGDPGPSQGWRDIPLATIEQWTKGLLAWFDLGLGYTVSISEKQVDCTFNNPAADLAEAGVPLAVYTFWRKEGTSEAAWTTFATHCQSLYAPE